VPRIVLALLVGLALTLSACGGGDDLTSESPSTVPDLTIPTTPDEQAAGDGEGDDADDAEGDATEGGGDTGAGNAGGDAGAGGGGGDAGAGGGGGQAAPAQPQQPQQGGDQGGAQGGGQAAPDQGQNNQPENTGGAQAGAASSDFCANNPGAC
jgi:hypothetical protein